jgi:hypothetical protein
VEYIRSHAGTEVATLRITAEAQFRVQRVGCVRELDRHTLGIRGPQTCCGRNDSFDFGSRFARRWKMPPEEVSGTKRHG